MLLCRGERESSSHSGEREAILSWTVTNPLSDNLYGLPSSSDGTKLYHGQYDGLELYTSSTDDMGGAGCLVWEGLFHILYL